MLDMFAIFTEIQHEGLMQILQCGDVQSVEKTEVEDMSAFLILSNTTLTSNFKV